MTKKQNTPAPVEQTDEKPKKKASLCKYQIWTESGTIVAGYDEIAEAEYSQKDRNERAAQMGLTVRYEIKER